MGSHQSAIRLRDRSIRINVIAEIGACDGLTRLALDLSLVGLINDAVGVRISNEEAQVDVIRATTTVDVRNLNGDDLFVSQACQRYAYLLPLKVGVPAVAVPPTTAALAEVTGVEGKDIQEVSADRKSYAGTYETKFYDLNDNFLFEDSGTLPATRLPDH
jgi:hypothetical protein